MVKQVLILGMHRSGTSALSELIQALGVHCDNENHGAKANWENPHGFWERQDVRRLNGSLLEAAGCNWHQLSTFNLENITQEARASFTEKAQPTIADLNKHPSWVIKDPRLCLLLPMWKRLLDRPICIIIWRDPLEVAKSLQTRNNFFISQGIALWEYYNLAALKNSVNLPRLIISHADLIANPLQTTHEIVDFLRGQGVEGLDRLDDTKLTHVIDPTLQHHKTINLENMQGTLNTPQVFLWQALKDKSALNWELIPDISNGCHLGLGEIERLGEFEKTFCMLEETVDYSFSLLDSLQYIFSKLVFKAYRRLIGKTGETLSLSAERNLHKVMHRFIQLKVNLLQEKRGFRKPTPPVLSQKRQQPALQLANDDISTDIVICIHNALEDVQAALTSITISRHHFSNLIIVNDGSDKPTTNFLHTFTEGKEWCTLLENPTPRGYTAAANQGMFATTAQFVVLVNSDVVVSRGWLQLLKHCAYSSAHIGIVGPLSNAATWQSIPRRFDQSGKWAINDIPSAWSVNKVQSLIANISERRYPRTQLLNGFCLGIKRQVFDRVGYLDEEVFPHGYGEENDFCIRASKAGFKLAIADDLFIYHAKSKSFGSARREELSKRGNTVLKKKYGRTFGTKYTKKIKEDAALARMRRRTATAYKWNISFDQPAEKTLLKVLFLLPCEPGSGGVHSVMQEVQGLNGMNIFATVAVPVRHRAGYKRFYNENFLHTVYFYSAIEEIAQIIPDYNVVIATLFTSVSLLKKLWEKEKNFLPAYYIQDYEPWFASSDFVTKWLASRSYTKVPNLCCFAKTDWICDIVHKKHKVTVHRVMPSLDHNVYFPGSRSRENRQDSKIHITAMVRPKTPRRRAFETMEVLQTIKSEYGDQVAVHVFGANSADQEFLKLNRNFDFMNHGFLTRESVANLLRNSDIFLDMSEWQAFGRTGIEAMACGCVPVLPIKGGVHEYAVDRHNAMIVDTDDERKVIAAIRELINTTNLLQILKENGLMDVKRYSIELASRSLALLFMEQLTGFQSCQKR